MGGVNTEVHNWLNINAEKKSTPNFWRFIISPIFCKWWWFFAHCKKDDLELSILINDFENDWKSITITWIITDYWKAIRCRLFLSQIEFDMKMSVKRRSKVFWCQNDFKIYSTEFLRQNDQNMTRFFYLEKGHRIDEFRFFCLSLKLIWFQKLLLVSDLKQLKRWSFWNCNL